MRDIWMDQGTPPMPHPNAPKPGEPKVRTRTVEADSFEAGYSEGLGAREAELERLGRKLELVEAERDMHYHFRACGVCRDYPNLPRCVDGLALKGRFRDLSLGAFVESSRTDN